MTAETHSQLASFIWSICNLLRGPYKRNEYRKVILPLTVLRRFDCLGYVFEELIRIGAE
jgi:type I restriction enzyme M protein